MLPARRKICDNICHTINFQFTLDLQNTIPYTWGKVGMKMRAVSTVSFLHIEVKRSWEITAFNIRTFLLLVWKTHVTVQVGVVPSAILCSWGQKLPCLHLYLDAIYVDELHFLKRPFMGRSDCKFFVNPSNRRPNKGKLCLLPYWMGKPVRKFLILEAFEGIVRAGHKFLHKFCKCILRWIEDNRQ